MALGGEKLPALSTCKQTHQVSFGNRNFFDARNGILSKKFHFTPTAILVRVKELE